MLPHISRETRASKLHKTLDTINGMYHSCHGSNMSVLMLLPMLLRLLHRCRHCFCWVGVNVLDVWERRRGRKQP
jgi:hypothetical protein